MRAKHVAVGVRVRILSGDDAQKLGVIDGLNGVYIALLSSLCARHQESPSGQQAK